MFQVRLAPGLLLIPLMASLASCPFSTSHERDRSSPWVHIRLFVMVPLPQNGEGEREREELERLRDSLISLHFTGRRGRGEREKEREAETDSVHTLMAALEDQLIKCFQGPSSSRRVASSRDLSPHPGESPFGLLLTSAPPLPLRHLLNLQLSSD